MPDDDPFDLSYAGIGTTYTQLCFFTIRTIVRISYFCGL